MAISGGPNAKSQNSFWRVSWVTNKWKQTLFHKCNRTRLLGLFTSSVLHSHIKARCKFMQLSLRGWLVTNSYQPTSRFNIYCGVLNYLLSSVFSFIQVETKQQQRQMFWPLPMQFVIFKGKISRKGIDKSSGSMLTAPLYSSNNSCKSRTAAMFIILMALTTGHYSWSSHNYKLCWWSVPSKLVNQELLPKTRS